MAWVGTYILDDKGEPQRASTIVWAQWFELNSEQRIIKRTIIKNKIISTVFLGLDYDLMSFLRQDDSAYKPMLWETAVFANTPGRKEVLEIPDRYRSKEDALAGHDKVVARVEQELVVRHG